jgi:hypothetical protein
VSDREAQPYVISAVPGSQAEDAFGFHEAFAAENPNIFPRSSEELRTYAENGELFAIRSPAGAIVGLCYLRPCDEGMEFGGLSIAKEISSMGLASVLARFSLAHWLSWEPGVLSRSGTQLRSNSLPIIGHVLLTNQDPRDLLEAVGFEILPENAKREYPGEGMPPGFPRNSKGKIEADLFTLRVEAVKRLEGFFKAFAGRSSKGARVDLNFGPALEVRNVVAILEDHCAKLGF